MEESAAHGSGDKAPQAAGDPPCGEGSGPFLAKTRPGVSKDPSEESPPESEDFFAKSARACAWPRRLRQGPVRMIAPEEIRTWILHEDARLLVISKPGDVVCHPSKAGPWSSLVGAVR